MNLGLDTNTVMVMCGLIYLLLPGVTWVAVSSMHQPSTQQWVLGSMLAGVAIIIIGLRNEENVFYTLLFGQTLLVYSFLLRTRSIQLEDLDRKAWTQQLLLIITLGHTAIMGVLWYWDQKYALNVWIRVQNAVVMVLFNLQLFRFAKITQSPNAYNLAIAYLLTTLAMLFNAVLTLQGQSDLFNINEGPGLLIAALALVFSSLLGNIYYVGVVYERSISAMADELARKERLSKDQDTLQTLAVLDREMRLGALTASLSHAISQPLASMLLYARQAQDQLKKTPENRSNAQKCLELIIKETDRATETIDEIRRFLKPKSIEVELFSPDVLRHNVLTLLKQELINNRHHINWPAWNQAHKVYGDKMQLTHAFLHILQVIMQKSPPEESLSIHISWYESGEKLTINVEHPSVFLTDIELKIPRMIIEQFDGDIQPIQKNKNSLTVDLICSTSNLLPQAHR